MSIRFSFVEVDSPVNANESTLLVAISISTSDFNSIFSTQKTQPDEPTSFNCRNNIESSSVGSQLERFAPKDIIAQFA